jgi:hypothetical protein
MDEKGLYLYAVAQGDREEPLEVKGIEGVPIHALEHQGLLAIAQDCEPKPFASEDKEVLANWLLIHQNVVDLAWERYETIIPFGFDRIIVSTHGKSARQNLNEWLEKGSADLKQKLARLQNKAEYGIQVSWDPTVILPRIRVKDTEIQDLEREIRSKPQGVAYLLQKKLEEVIRQRLEKAADLYFKTFYQEIRARVENVHVEKVRKEDPPKQMILNVSCLQNKGETESLGQELDRMGQIPGFYVRFTGPWPPYSFVNG